MLDANERLVVLKARQLGITWVVLAHALYSGTFWGNRLFLIVSQTGDDAIAALERIRIMWASMPDEWRPELVKNNTEEILFANGSRFRAGKATKRFGRGQAAFMTIADETAFWEWADEQMTSLDAGAQRLFAVTTGNGPEDYTHRLWRKAVAGEGRWAHVFFPWHVHPDRNDAWYEDNVLQSSEPRLARREFAATAEEAFAAPEGIYFQRWSEINKVAAKPQHNWTTWRAVDFGFHWPACLWVQESPSGQPIVVAELAGREPFDWTTSEFADAILAKDKTLGLVTPLRATFCDPEGTGVDPQTGESEFAVFAAKGLAPPGSDRRYVTAACGSSSRFPTPTCRYWSPKTARGCEKRSARWRPTSTSRTSTTTIRSTTTSWTRCATTSSTVPSAAKSTTKCLSRPMGRRQVCGGRSGS